MIPSELRKKAREALKGNWGKALLVTIAYVLITVLISVAMVAFEKNTAIFIILYILEIVIAVPLSYGFLISFTKLKRGEATSTFDFITEGFSRFTRSWSIWFQIFIRMLLPMVCMIFVMILMSLLLITNVNYLVAIIGSILLVLSILYLFSRALLYSIAYYISYDNSDMSAKACVKKSEELMRGNRGNIFLLELSFIGWIFLSVLSLGIGFFWLLPYMQVSLVCFYERVAKVETKKVDGKVEIETEE